VLRQLFLASLLCGGPSLLHAYGQPPSSSGSSLHGMAPQHALMQLEAQRSAIDCAISALREVAEKSTLPLAKADVDCF